MKADKIMDHTNYPKNLKKKSHAELLYIIQDAGEAARANPDNPNVGYYLDEVSYAGMELNRRKK